MDLSESFAKDNHLTFFWSILLAYKNFSLSYDLQRVSSFGERKILFLSFTAALILFLGNLPHQIAILPIFISGNITLYVGLLSFIALFFMPLFLYLLSAVLFVLLKVFKGHGSFYEIRLAFFWSINVAGPILIINGLLKGFFFNSESIIYVNLILEASIGWIFSNMIAEAKQFRSKYPLFFCVVFLIILPQLMTLI